MFLLITLALTALAAGIELLYLRAGIFRLLHWESLALLGAACITSLIALRRRRRAASILLAATLPPLTLLYAWMTIWAPRIDLTAAPFEQPGYTLHLELRDPWDNPHTLPADLTTERALLVFFRGWW